MGLETSRFSGDTVRIISDAYPGVRIVVTRSRSSVDKWSVTYHHVANAAIGRGAETKGLATFNNAEDAILFAKEYLEDGEEELTKALNDAGLA